MQHVGALGIHYPSDGLYTKESLEIYDNALDTCKLFGKYSQLHLTLQDTLAETSEQDQTRDLDFATAALSPEHSAEAFSKPALLEKRLVPRVSQEQTYMYSAIISGD